MKVCPSCRKGDIELFIGGQTGSYKCNNCGYIGPLVIEMEKTRKKNNSRKNKWKLKK